jgi:integrase
MFDENILRKYALPESAVNGQELRYDPRDDVWEVSSGNARKLDLSRYREDCTPAFLQSLKLALVTMNRRLQPSTLKNYLRQGLNPLLETMGNPIGEIGQADLEAYWFTLPPNWKHKIKNLKPLCEALARHGIPNHSITPDALNWFNTIKPGCNETGLAVRIWDPVRGPLTPDELDGFLRALHAAFARAEISAEDYFLILLFAAFGARNANLADLKVCDLRVMGIDGATSFELDIPRVKQRGGRFRESFYTRKLVPEFGAALEGYNALQMEQHADLGCGDQLPMFVDPGNKDKIRTYHRNGHQIMNHVINLGQRLAVVSGRTEDVMHINPRRFRYTVATLARASGLDPSAIAALLDHGNTRTQEVYAAIGPEVLAEYTRRLSGFRDPLAAAFMGRVAEPGEAVDPQMLVFRARFRKDCPEPSVGGCDASRKCAGRRPYVCYLCALFVASMEGDHEGALADVLEDRVRFDQNAGDSLRFLTADSVAQAIRKVIALVHARLEVMGKNLEQIRQEKEALLRERGIIV